MDLQARKISFVQEFLRLQNESIITNFEKLLKKKRSEIFDKNLNPMSLARFNKDIDQSLDDSENNRIISARDLKTKYS